MASPLVRIAAMAEISRAPLRSPADVTIEPPHDGHLRVHLSLTDLPSNAVTLALDIVPTRTEVGSVRVNNHS